MLLRHILDKLFTSLAGLSVVLMAAALVVILGPIVWRGAGAVAFRGTVEFRRMQLGEFHRGDGGELAAEKARTDAARAHMYAAVDAFSEGIRVDRLQEQAKDACRLLDGQLQNRQDAGQLSPAEARKLNRAARNLRNRLLEAFEATDRAEALRALQEVLDNPDAPALAGTAAETLLPLARRYRKIVQEVNLADRDKYAAELEKVSQLVVKLFGPRTKDTVADLAQFRYGATRWDRALLLQDQILWTDKWAGAGAGQVLRQVRTPRAELLPGPEMAEFFRAVRDDLPAMLQPRATFYWQYLTDNSTTGHFFGGVGPEALGTLLLTVLAMLLAVPVGVTTAAYLVECTRESHLLRVLRTCINTLAGVPSIVFGLFGLAFFVLWLLPKFGLHGVSVLAGALTLGVLVLPVVIRSSEEAIRAVPMSYKEASLALGAGGLRTFLTVTLPAALPGILTGVILAMSRAAGETAPILFTAAVAVGPWPGSPFKPCRTLSYGALDLATGDRIAPEVPHNQFGMILVLVLLVLALNVTAIVVRSRLSRKLRGG
jgi:phosphate transport system permease protein